jgi:nucleotide-binding universal stress UspA family protein
LSEPRLGGIPIVGSVLHPTDFSKASERAFAHALALALIGQTRLTLLHVAAGSTEHPWTDFPPVRSTLERWGLLEIGSPRSAVFKQLGLRVEKVASRGRNPVEAIVEQLETDPMELVVFATEGREGLPRWLKRSVAEAVARQSGTMTLFVPRDARGFVSLEDGRLRLRRILVPVDEHPPADAAIGVACRIAAAIGEQPVEIALLHVSDAWDEGPLPRLPTDAAWQFHRSRRRGEPVEEIVAKAEEDEADLIVMVTQGRDGVLDALRGTTTEQVLRRSPCPVLAVPSRRSNAASPGGD